MEVTPGWLFSAFAALAGAGLLGIWSFQHADYGDKPFWAVMADADAARAIRGWAGAAVLLFGFGIWRLFASAATPKVVGEDDPELERVRAILAKADAVFDLAGVTDVDSSGLAVIFGWQREAKRLGKNVRIANPPHNLRSLADVYGVSELLPL